MMQAAFDASVQKARDEQWRERFNHYLMQIQSFREVMHKIQDAESLIDRIIYAAQRKDSVPVEVVESLAKVDEKYTTLNGDIEKATENLDAELKPVPVENSLGNMLPKKQFQEMFAHFLQQTVTPDISDLVVSKHADISKLVEYLVRAKYDENLSDANILRHVLPDLTQVIFREKEKQEIEIVPALERAYNGTTKYILNWGKTLGSKLKDNVISEFKKKVPTANQQAFAAAIQDGIGKDFRDFQYLRKLRTFTSENAWAKVDLMENPYIRNSSGEKNRITFRLCGTHSTALDVDSVVVVTAVLKTEVLWNKRHVVLILLEFQKADTIINNMNFLLADTSPMLNALDKVIVETVNIAGNVVNNKIDDIVKKYSSLSVPVTFVFVMGNYTPRSSKKQSFEKQYETFEKEFDKCAEKVSNALNDDKHDGQRFVMLCRFKDSKTMFQDKIDYSGWSPCGCRIDKSTHPIIQRCEPKALGQDVSLNSGFNYEALGGIEVSEPVMLDSAESDFGGIHAAPSPATGDAEDADMDAEDADMDNSDAEDADMDNSDAEDAKLLVPVVPDDASELFSAFDPSSGSSWNLEFDTHEQHGAEGLKDLLNAKHVLRNCVEATDILELVLVDDNVD